MNGGGVTPGQTPELIVITSGNDATLGVRWVDGTEKVLKRVNSSLSPQIVDDSLEIKLGATCQSQLGLTSYPANANPFIDYDSIPFDIVLSNCSIEGSMMNSKLAITVGGFIWMWGPDLLTPNDTMYMEPSRFVLQ